MFITVDNLLEGEISMPFCSSLIFFGKLTKEKKNDFSVTFVVLKGFFEKRIFPQGEAIHRFNG